MIKQALDLGVNFIDTANTYAHGTSEEFIGGALKTLGVKREDVVLATKVYFNEGKLSHSAIKREIDGSLQCLGIDYVDLYQIHRFDYDTPIEETMETLDELVKAGKVRALGASAMYGYQFHNMQIITEKNGWTQFSTMQNHYNLLYREDERELIPVCKQYGVSLVPYSPFAAGHLTRSTWDNSASERSMSDKVARSKYDASRAHDEQIIKRVHELSLRYGVSMAQISLASLASQGVTAPSVGATSPRHFADAVRYGDVELTQTDVDYLSEPYVAHELVGLIEHK